MKRWGNGFTLLEMLVVLVVFGLLMVAITQAMRFAGQASQIGARALTWLDQIEPADRALRAMIEQIRPQGTLETDPALVADAGSMVFKTEVADPSLALGHAQLQVRLRFDAEGRLMAQTQPAPHAIWIGAPPAVRDIVLVDRLAGGRFAYWDGAHWLDEWTENGLPRLIRIRLRFPVGDARRWPDIIASPLRDPLP